MADPQIDNVVRAQCIWSAPSGLPEDRFVTTWAFVRGGIGTDPFKGAEAQADEVAERLREFWLEPTSVQAMSVSQCLPVAIANRGLEIRCYDLGQAPPRQPRIYNYPVANSGAGKALPEEVAIAMSFYAERNLPRQRGRVFIGPLTDSVVVDGTPVRVNGSWQQILSAAANRLALETGVGDSMRWGVLSQADGEIRPVTAGWVDDAFDTIRKRGSAPSGRSEWPSP